MGRKWISCLTQKKSSPCALHDSRFVTADSNLVTPPESWLVARITVHVTWVPWRALSGQHEDHHLNRQICLDSTKPKTEWHFQGLATRAMSSRRPYIRILESLTQKKIMFDFLSQWQPSIRGTWTEGFLEGKVQWQPSQQMESHCRCAASEWPEPRAHWPPLLK